MARYNGALISNKVPAQQGPAKDKQTLATQVWVNDAVAANDTFYFGKLPKGAVITGGRVFSGRLASGTSAGSCSFSFCLGVDQILADASATTYSVASVTSALGVWGPIDFNAATGSYTGSVKFEAGFNAPLGGLLMTKGPLSVTAEANVFATLTVSAGNGSGTSAYLNIEVDYYTGTHS